MVSNHLICKVCLPFPFKPLTATEYNRLRTLIHPVVHTGNGKVHDYGRWLALTQMGNGMMTFWAHALGWLTHGMTHIDKDGR